jgi:hypothetical protein
VVLGKVTHGQKTPMPVAKPLGSALLVLHNLKLHGDQQRENMAPFELYCHSFCFRFVPSFYPIFGEFVLQNVIWIDSYKWEFTGKK